MTSVIDKQRVLSEHKSLSQKSNGIVRSSLFWPEYFGPLLEVVYFDCLNRSGWNSPLHLDKPVCWRTPLWLLSVIWRIGEVNEKMSSADPLSWMGLIRLCCSIFTWLVTLVTDWVVWHKHPIFLFSFFCYFLLPFLGVLECRLPNGFTQLSNFRYQQNCELSLTKWMCSMLPCICSVIDQRWCQHMVRTKRWYAR